MSRRKAPLADRLGKPGLLHGMPARCAGCGNVGPIPALGACPAWCTCKPPTLGGPYVAPEGVRAMLVTQTPEQVADMKVATAIRTEWVHARDALTERWVRRGSGWYELPLEHPKRAALEKRWQKACRAVRKLERECPHPFRSIFDPCSCGRCGGDVEKRRAA